ncbi:molybdenum cofactor guanylyltransferase MobA [Pseudooceanicola sp. HF7]|uniref:molybdenum cofactor guanylyltransferase MobA n=1 Tax=Pseudooceanicola sp. HF7 TaxID=2721560 RepID=UPI00143039A2|nr:molybdenum cofactor guanylyltransferase MobA [Pseudooceanicola sp. HF7]
MEIPGVILAGGLSRRMGGVDKALMTFGRGTLIGQVVDRFEPQVSRLAINANAGTAGYSALGLPVIADSLPDHPGPLAGVLAAMDWAAEQGAAQVVTAAADTPFLPGDLVPQLLLAAELGGKDRAVAASVDARGELRDHPTFGLWPVARREELRRALQAGLRRMRDWADAERTARAVFPSELGDPFFNINRPEDLAQAQAMLKS